MHRLAAGAQHPAHAVGGQLHVFGDLFGRRLATVFLLQLLSHLIELADPPAQMGRDADGAAVVSQGARHRLPDPPRRISAEAVATPVIVFFDGLHQADVAFLNEIQELEAAATILFGDADDQASVGANQVGASGIADLTLTIQQIFLVQVGHLAGLQPLDGGATGLDLHRQVHFLVGREQALLAHLAEIEADRIIDRHVTQIEQRCVMGAHPRRTDHSFRLGQRFLFDDFYDFFIIDFVAGSA